jgi:hypothetical protein
MLDLQAGEREAVAELMPLLYGDLRELGAFDTKSGLGTALLRQQKCPEAVTLLLECLRGMQARAVGHAAQAAEWKAKLEAAQREQ